MKLKSVFLLSATSCAVALSSFAQASELEANNLYFPRDKIALNKIRITVKSQNIDPSFSRCESSTEILKQLSNEKIQFEVGNCTKILTKHGIFGTPKSEDRAELKVSVSDSFLLDSADDLRTTRLDEVSFGSTDENDVSKMMSACEKVSMDLGKITLAGESAKKYTLKLKPARVHPVKGVPGCEIKGGEVVLSLRAYLQDAI